MTGVLKDRECAGDEEERVGGKEDGKAPQPVATVAGDQLVSLGAPPSLEISVTELSEDRECCVGGGGEEEGRSGGRESRAAPQPVTSDVIELYIEEESVGHLEEKDSVNTDTRDGYSAMSLAPGRGGVGETLNTDGASDLVEYTLTVVDKVVEVADSGEGEGEGVSETNQSKFMMQDDRVGIISDSESGQSVSTHAVESEYVDHTVGINCVGFTISL